MVAQDFFTVAKKHSPHGLMLVVTDTELLGLVYEEGKWQLDLRKKFYEGETMELRALEPILETAYIIHFTGKRSVALGLRKGFVSSKNVLNVQGIPHAEVILG